VLDVFLEEDGVPSLSEIEVEPEVSGFDALSASFELSASTSILAKVAESATLAMDDDNEIIPREKLNEMFPGRARPFDKDMTLSAASYLDTKEKDQNELRARIEAGPDGMVHGLTNFAAQMVPHIFDPFAVAGAFVGSYVLSAGAAAAGVSTVLGIGTKATELGAKQLLLRSAAEGVTGEVLTEPVRYALSKNLGEDYSLVDSGISIVGGVVGYAGLTTIGRVGAVSQEALRYGINKSGAFLKRTGVAAEDAVNKTALAQALSGKKVDVEPVIKDMASATNIPASKFTSNPGPNTYHAVLDGAKSDLETGTPRIIHEDYGGRNAVTVTKYRETANGEAARPYNDGPATVFEGELPEARNLIDLESPAPQELKESAMDLLEGVMGKEGATNFNGTSEELLEAVRVGIHQEKIPETALHDLADKLEAMGFDGYKSSGKEFMGVKHEVPSETITLFNKSKFTPKKEVEVDSELFGKLGDDEIRSLKDKQLSPESDFGYDADAVDSFKKLSGEFIPKKPQEIDAEIDTGLQDLTAKLGDDPRVGEIKKLIQDSRIEEEKFTTAFNEAFTCLGGR